MGHYFEERPAVGSARRTLRLRLPDLDVPLVTDRGVFSGSRIDPGTRLLLTEATMPEHGDVLDLGCGYGPIAIALALRAPAVTVWAIDVNERAQLLTQENAAATGATNVRVVSPEALPPEVGFSALYSNPPVRIGKDALHHLLRTWLARLDDEGDAWLVVQRHLGSDSLARWLDDEGWPTTRVASRSGYRVLHSRRP